MELSLVEMIDPPVFDQSCRHGGRVEGHSVYCHNENWPEHPRKCRRTWYTGGKVKDEDCPGYEPNNPQSGEVKEGGDDNDGRRKY